MNATEAIEYLQKKVDPTEPVFILRGRDVFAPGTIRFWARELTLRNQNIITEKSVLAVLVSQEIIKWQMTHPDQVKVPD